MYETKVKATLMRKLTNNQLYSDRYETIVSERNCFSDSIMRHTNIATFGVKFKIDFIDKFRKGNESLEVYISKYSWELDDIDCDESVFTCIFDCDGCYYEATMYVTKHGELRDLVVEEWDTQGDFEDSEEPSYKYYIESGISEVKKIFC